MRITVFLCTVIFVTVGKNVDGKKQRVCVIGAGAAGLCALRHLTRDSDYFEPMAFEQSNDVGGVWNYVEKTGVDEHGFPIHSSMYKNLRTNFPLALMNFPDYTTMGNSSDVATGTHEQVLSYLKDYAENFRLRQYIQFNTRVESVRPLVNETDWRQTTWKVRVRNVKTNITEERDFNAVIICNGHTSEPYVPNIPGIETFTGDVIHSHDYRRPEEYSGKRVIVLGLGESGIDILNDLTGYAKYVYLSHNYMSMNSQMPINSTEIGGVRTVEGNNIIVGYDNKIVTADSIIFTTGYKYCFSFLDETCKIRVNDKYVTPLYKHLVNIEHPSMSIIGIPQGVINFPLFHMQVQFYLALLKGHINLPTKDEMIEASKVPSYKQKRAHFFGNKQFEYFNELADYGGFNRLQDYYKNGYDKWSTNRNRNILSNNYKNSKIIIDSDNITVNVIPLDK